MLRALYHPHPPAKGGDSIVGDNSDNSERWREAAGRTRGWLLWSWTVGVGVGCHGSGMCVCACVCECVRAYVCVYGGGGKGQCMYVGTSAIPRACPAPTLRLSRLAAQTAAAHVPRQTQLLRVVRARMMRE
jgi:hypothetical protein